MNFHSGVAPSLNRRTDTNSDDSIGHSGPGRSSRGLAVGRHGAVPPDRGHKQVGVYTSGGSCTQESCGFTCVGDEALSEGGGWSPILLDVVQSM
ncbi:hypothetical protein NL676_035613 [Syzygium grande]|nr:hypothetical protein NL676_035613 [Syzygium grande]